MNKSETSEPSPIRCCRHWVLVGACILAPMVILMLGPITGNEVNAEAPVLWTGKGGFRILVDVPPRDLGKRVADEMPADVGIDLTDVLDRLGVDSLADISSLQVIRYDVQTGKPIAGSKFLHGRGDFDCPFRWYDAAIPYEFPEVADDVSRTGGELRRTPVTRGGYFYNAIGDWKRGRLAWLHTQEKTASSHYAVYFNVLPPGETANSVPPRGWLGDGLPRCGPLGASTMGADHCRIDLDDWNDDGLIDLIVGEAYGHLFWWPNRGTPTEPRFPYMKFLSGADGLPLDAGSAAAPKVVDWNSDGKKDLLLGAEWNRILVFRNEGTNANRQLKYAGLLKADGETLKLPIKPLVRGSTDIFKRDYYAVLETVDWDDDGDVDLIAGGYITGRIFFYENEGRGEDGFPKLAFRGPLQADGEPLNVAHWCAAPCLADIDGDGDFDLMSGSMRMTPSGGDGPQAETFLRYYENRGTRRVAQFHEQPFPSEGAFPRAQLATPRAHDWDDDGDLDLVVSARNDIFLFENDGGPTSPKFIAHQKPLPSQWGAARIPGNQILDYNGDGRPDCFMRGRYTVRLNSGKGNPWSWDEPVSVLPPGKHISHSSGIGDDWFWPFLDDFNQDGKMDILFGDWFGHVWFHANNSTDKADVADFDLTGEKLTLKNGQPVKVGPIGKDITTDFNALQGARTVLSVADVDRDGRRDLIVGDTYGIVRFFRNVGTQDEPTFATAEELGNLGIRLLVDTADWNQDGWTDVVAGAANGRVRVFLNTGKSDGRQFSEGFDPSLPRIPQPRVLMSDLNGDGDEDLFLPSTQGSCLVERSFLERGYARGHVKSIERRP